MPHRPTSSRRQFLRHVAGGAAGALALPSVFPSTILGANDRILLGHVGLRNRGENHLSATAKDTIAVCDVDREILAERAATAKSKGANSELATYSDYRALFERKDVDAVVISTPDHWHAIQTIDACLAGKDVYCEKPLGLVIAEGRRMVEVARQTKRIVQTGSQQRSNPLYPTACEYVRNGRLGKIERILVGIPGVNFSGPAIADSSPPGHLDYDLWLGPAPARPYNEKRVHYNFRFFWDYSAGQITNFGAHDLDIVQWALGMDSSGPVEIEGEATYHGLGWFEVPETLAVRYRYANGVEVSCGTGHPGGVTFVGEHGTIRTTRGKLENVSGKVLDEPIGDGERRLPRTHPNHLAQWLECVRSRELPICDVEIGHRSATVCHLGTIAVRTGRKIHWDPTSERIIGDPEAQSMVSKPYRAPWTLS
jgi:predicted dehydrogenase